MHITQLRKLGSKYSHIRKTLKKYFHTSRRVNLKSLQHLPFSFFNVSYICFWILDPVYDFQLLHPRKGEGKETFYGLKKKHELTHTSCDVSEQYTITGSKQQRSLQKTVGPQHNISCLQ